MQKTINAILTVAMLAAVISVGTAALASEGASGASVVNINTATVSELSFLPGVGPSKAEAIVKYRKNRPFKKVDHIMRVKGIGRKSFRRMKPYLSVDGSTTATKKIKGTK